MMKRQILSRFKAKVATSRRKTGAECYQCHSDWMQCWNSEGFDINRYLHATMKPGAARSPTTIKASRALSPPRLGAAAG
jgi:hypothetical protein